MTDAWMPGAQRLPAAADGGCLKGGAPRAVWLVLHADPVTVSARDAAERLIELGRPCHLVWNPLSGEVAQLIPVIRAGRALGWADGPQQGPRSAGLGWGGQPGWGSGCGWADPAGRPGRSGGPDWAATATGRSRATGRRTTSGRSSRTGPGPGLDAGPRLDPWGGLDAGHRLDPRFGRAADGRGGGPPEEPIAPSARDGLAGVNNEGRVCAQIGVVGHGWAPFTTGPVRRAREIVSWLDSWHVARGWPAGHPAPFPGSARPGQQRRRAWARGGHFGASQVPGCSGSGPGAIDIERLTGPLTGGQRVAPAPRVPGSPARISAMTWQPRLTAARSAAP